MLTADSLPPVFVVTTICEVVVADYFSLVSSVLIFTLIFIACWHPENFNVYEAEPCCINQQIHTFRFVYCNTEFDTILVVCSLTSILTVHQQVAVCH